MAHQTSEPQAYEQPQAQLAPHLQQQLYKTPDTFGKPTPAIVATAWVGLGLSLLIYGISLWRATSLEQFEKGFLFVVLLFGLASAVTLQKSVRDRHEGVPVTNLFIAVAWIGLAISLGSLVWGFWNLDILPSEKATYGMSFSLALFAVVVVQKNVRDLIAYKARHPELYGAGECGRRGYAGCETGGSCRFERA